MYRNKRRYIEITIEIPSDEAAIAILNLEKRWIEEFIRKPISYNLTHILMYPPMNCRQLYRKFTQNVSKYFLRKHHYAKAYL